VVVAVGTIIADRPPHRTVRAALPHTAPTLEDLSIPVENSSLYRSKIPHP
jgi:hypothetical protein